MWWKGGISFAEGRSVGLRDVCALQQAVASARIPCLVAVRARWPIRGVRVSVRKHRERSRNPPSPSQRDRPDFPMPEFYRLTRLPPYVFSITTELKMAARRRGEDIIDFGMGNPDGPTPQHIVDKLIETVRRGDTHGYSVSKGIPRLRKAICDWYQRRWGVEFDPDSEAI